jgi:hypothetical protein
VFEGLKSRIFSIHQNTEESVLFVLKNQPLIDTAVHTGSFSCTLQEIRNAGEVPAGVYILNILGYLERLQTESLFGINEKV